MEEDREKTELMIELQMCIDTLVEIKKTTECFSTFILAEEVLERLKR